GHCGAGGVILARGVGYGIAMVLCCVWMSMPLVCAAAEVGVRVAGCIMNGYEDVPPMHLQNVGIELTSRYGASGMICANVVMACGSRWMVGGASMRVGYRRNTTIDIGAAEPLRQMISA